MKKAIALTAAAFLQVVPFNASIANVDKLAVQLSASAALPFRPDAWKGPSEKRMAEWFDYNANCYEYALGDTQLKLSWMTNKPAPGELSGHPFNAQGKEGASFAKYIATQAMFDGLQPTGREIHQTPNAYPVALFVRSTGDAKDFHWLRLNGRGAQGAGFWSQKFSGRIPENITYEDGTPVRDPSRISITMMGRAQKSPCADCYEFLGYYNVPRTGLQVSQRVGRRLNRSQLNVLVPQG